MSGGGNPGSGQWPLSESNTSPDAAEKQGVTDQPGTESGTVGGDLGFVEAIASLMQLPLSDGEKAEALRRLLR